MEHKYDVFISYSRKDTRTVDKICEAFDANGITYFIDRAGIGGGSEFPAVLANAIKSSKLFLFIGSKNSYDSKFTQSEVVFAFNKKEKGEIIPYIIDGSNLPDELDFTFSAINRRNIKDHPIETVLINDINSKLGRESNFNSEEDNPPTPDPKPGYLKYILGVLAVALGVVIGVVMTGDEPDPIVEEVVAENVITVPKEGVDSKQSNTFTANDVTFKMIAVQGGTYTMGAADNDPEAYDWEKPAHKETVSDFMIGETPVTQKLWQAVMGSNPSNFKGDMQRPVEQVSWNDCQTFIRKLNQLTGQNFRLPSEAEWEYAARGGNRSNGYKYAGSNSVGTVAWYDGNSGSTTHKVKTKQPNELGIYDMSGNVWEWCQDKWCDNYNSLRNSGYRVLRGGSWINYAGYVRVSNRNYLTPGNRYRDLGLRLAL